MQLVIIIVFIALAYYWYSSYSSSSEENFSAGTLVDLQSSTPYLYGPTCGNMPFYRHPMFFVKHPYHIMTPPNLPPYTYPMWGRTRDNYF